MENPIKMDDSGVPPIFGNIHFLVFRWEPLRVCFFIGDLQLSKDPIPVTRWAPFRYQLEVGAIPNSTYRGYNS